MYFKVTSYMAFAPSTDDSPMSCKALWIRLLDTNVSEEHTASIFRAEGSNIHGCRRENLKTYLVRKFPC
jgi:hypothetical protein